MVSRNQKKANTVFVPSGGKFLDNKHPQFDRAPESTVLLGRKLEFSTERD
jgi:hypothetical protein